MTTRRALLLLLLVGASSAAQEGTPEIAIEGLDPVLLVQGREVQGRSEIHAVHGGLEYLFASAESRALFESDEQRYAVQLAGACARMGAPTRGNPDLYTVHDGRIYLFGSEDCRRLFQAAPSKYLEPEQPPLARSPEAERRARAFLDKAVAWMGGEERLGGLLGYELRTRLVETRPNREIQISHHTTALFPARIRDEAVTPWGESTQVLAPDDAFLLTPRGARPLHSLERRELETVQHRLPLVILRLRVEPGFVAVHAGSGLVGESAVEQVELELAGLRMTLGIEAASGRIASLAYRGRRPGGEVGNVVEVFSDYRSALGLTLPYRSTASVDGAPLRVLSLESLTLDPHVEPALFARPPVAAR
jgi:YHS domain-containing protein